MIPIWQLMLGVCIGIVTAMVIRPQRIGYDQPQQQPRQEDKKKQSGEPKANGESNHNYNSKPGDKCSICLEDMSNENMGYLPCRHALHMKCYEENNQKIKRCPICREPIVFKTV